MSEQGRRELAIGGFVLVGLALVGLMFWILSEETFKKKYRVSAVFSYAGGIREGTPVHMAGKPIGEVRDVRFVESDDKVLVDVVIEIEQKYDIKKDSKLTVGSVGLLGEKILEFSLGTRAAGNIDKDGKARFDGVVPPGLDDLQKTIDVAVNDVRGTIVKVNEFLDHLNSADFQASLKGAIQGVNDLAAKANGTMEKVDGFVVKADEFAGKANNAMDGVNKIITDADEFVAKMNELSAKLSGVADDVKKVVGDAGTSVEKLSDSLSDNSKKLNDVLAEVESLLKDAKGGKGTLGALLTDDTTARRLNELLASLKVTSDSLSRTSDYLRDNPNSIIFGKSGSSAPPRVDWRDRK